MPDARCVPSRVDRQLPYQGQACSKAGKEETMRTKWRIILILTAILLLAFSVSLAWSAPQKAGEAPKFVLRGDVVPTFAAKDREAIEGFYRHLMGTLAPGSINRSPFSPAIEKALATGSHVPMGVEKDLTPLPKELESQLTILAGDYRRFKVGPHVVLVKVADSTIADIIKNAGTAK
jgi:hypothetical protein